MKIERVWVRELSRHAFAYSATWNVDGREVIGKEVRMHYPPEALWATEDRRQELMAIGAHKGLLEEARKKPAPTFKLSPEEIAVNQWDGSVIVSDPFDSDANVVVAPPALRPHSA